MGRACFCVLSATIIKITFAINFLVGVAVFAADQGWPSYGGSPGGSRYSGLTGITSENVAGLKEAWTYHSGDVADGSGDELPTALEVTPIFVNNSLYLCTPNNRVIALDPGTGREKWRFDPGMDTARSDVGIPHCRGVAFWQRGHADDESEKCNKRIFSGTGDGRVIAIDADNGRLCTAFGEDGEIDLNRLEKFGTGVIGMTSAPAIIGDKVVVGSMIPSYERTDSPDGVVWAFDVITGEVAWKWNPVPEHLREQTGGINVWAPISVDEQEGLIFLPTSSPTPDNFGGIRSQDIPYANAVVALDANTGTPRWHFQTVHHDLWDYDLPAQPTLMNIQRDNETVPALAQVTKMGFVFVLDRRTGEPLFPVEERPVPVSDVEGEASAPTQPWPLLPPPINRQQLDEEDAWGLTFWDRGWCRDKIGALRNEGLFTPPSVKGSLHYPTSAGGPNWGGASYDPVSQLLVTNVTNVAGHIRLTPREEFEKKNPDAAYSGGMMLGTPYVVEQEPLLSPLGIPCSPPPWGELSAIDMVTGKIRWRRPFGSVKLFGPISSPAAWGSPNIGGSIITAGGLVFIAAGMDSKIHGYDLETGKQLWSANLPAPGMATPMTYAFGDNQQQYLVIAAGGHPRYRTKLSDAIVAFSLDKD